MTDILPCPFCGSTNIHDLPNFDWVACHDCGAQIEDGEPSARELWNRRTFTPAQPPGIREALKAAREYIDADVASMEPGWRSAKRIVEAIDAALVLPSTEGK